MPLFDTFVPLLACFVFDYFVLMLLIVSCFGDSLLGPKGGLEIFAGNNTYPSSTPPPTADCQYPGQSCSHPQPQIRARGLLHEHSEHCAAGAEVSLVSEVHRIGSKIVKTGIGRLVFPFV